jgi:hypothetical protein
MSSVVQDNSVTFARIQVPYNESSISKIAFISEYHDSSPDGPPGKN